MLNRHLPERYDTFCIHSSNQHCLRPQTEEAHGFCPADAAKIKKQQTTNAKKQPLRILLRGKNTKGSFLKMAKIIECVPNISEGRNHEVIEACVDTVRNTAGVTLLDYSSDAATTAALSPSWAAPKAL